MSGGLGFLLVGGAQAVKQYVGGGKTAAPASEVADFFAMMRSPASPQDQPPLQTAINPPQEGDMTNKTINAALDAAANFEGGYVNDPDDPGGETNKGVTLRTLQSVNPKATSDDLKKLTGDGARKIFRELYVDKPGLDKLPDVLQAEAVGLSINAGASRAIKVLQKAAGVEQDGKLGPVTLAAVRKLDNNAVKEAVDDFYIGLVEQRPKLKKFLKGWLNRSAGMSAIPLDTEE